MPSPLGVIAGKGDLPRLLVREAKSAGRRVAAIAFDKTSASALSDIADDIHVVGLGQAGRTIGALRGAGVVEVVFVGKVDKRVLFKNPRLDVKAISILRRLKGGADDVIMGGIAGELEREGFKVVSQADILKNLMPGPGVLSKREPGEREWEDIRFGMTMARGIAGLDIGQTVVVRDGAVLAVEAIEGTDEAIERGGGIAGKGAVVCKVSKPRQDPRFDIPTVGANTVETMAKVRASVLAIEAGATVVAGMEETVRLCGRKGIAFVSVQA